MPDARVFLITGAIQEFDAEYAAGPVDLSNRTSTFVHVVDNQNIVFPYACTLFFNYPTLKLFGFVPLNRRETAFNGSKNE